MSLSRRLAMTTSLVAACIGYGRNAFAACVQTGPTTYTCSGVNVVPQVIALDNVAVVTDPGFSVNSVGTAISVTGDGDISFTDANVSPITGALIGLYVDGTGPDGLNPGSVTVEVNGDVTGTGYRGIFAINRAGNTDISITTGAGSSVSGADRGITGLNYGTGDLTITVEGDATGTTGRGVSGYNHFTANDLTITTGINSTVLGGYRGISAFSYGTGVVTVTANGTVTGTTGAGIYASNAGTDLLVTTGSASVVTGGVNGVRAANQGTGDTIVTVEGKVTGGSFGISVFDTGAGAASVVSGGEVTGTGITGIGVVNYGTSISVTTEAGSKTLGGLRGISVDGRGSDAVTILAEGVVTGTDFYGIYGRNLTGKDISVTTGAGSVVTGGFRGLRATNYGSGTLLVTVEGDVVGTTDRGISTYNDASTTSHTVITGANSSVLGGNIGINANNAGSGALHVTANGSVTGTASYGIFARTYANGTNTTVTTGVGSSVTGGFRGIRATNYGTGALTVVANGDVIGTSDRGISAYNSGGTDLTITTGAGSSILGGNRGIVANNNGTGLMAITVNGDVTGTFVNGVSAKNYANATSLSVETGEDSKVQGAVVGIDANNYGTGALTVLAKGQVVGTDFYGLSAYNAANGTNLAITATATSSIVGGFHGIRAVNDGAGSLSITADGEVTGTDATGIQAINRGTALSAGTAVGSSVVGGQFGMSVLNYGSGALTVTANGYVRGITERGIQAINVGTSLAITTGANSNITGATRGITGNNYGSGATTITVEGEVTGTGDRGISGYNHFNAASLTITTGTTSKVFGGVRGISAANYGSGPTVISANADVTGKTGAGINVFNLGTQTIDVTVGAGAVVTGGTSAVSMTITGGGGASDAVLENAGTLVGNGVANATVFVSTVDGATLDNLAGGVIRGAAGLPTDLIVDAIGGGVAINNAGTMVGRISLTDEADVFNNTSLVTWTVSGDNLWGGGFDELNNSGRIEVVGNADFIGLELFDNFGAGGSDEVGVIDMLDGDTAESLDTDGDYEGGNGSALWIDADLDAATGAADRFFIDGSAGGQTLVTLNDLNAGFASAYDPGGFLVIDVDGGADGQENFVLADGPIEKGFFDYDLYFVPGLGGDDRWYLQNAPNIRAHEAPKLISGAQAAWHIGAATWLERTADLRVYPEVSGEAVNGGGTVSPGVWFRAFGSFGSRDVNHRVETASGPESADGSYDQNFYGLQFGADFPVIGPNPGGGNLLLGVLGGYTDGRLRFDSTGDEATIGGFNVGAYGTYMNGGFFLDLLAKVDFHDIDFDTTYSAPDKSDDTNGLSYGVTLDTGYRFDLSSGWFAEPKASLAYVHTTIDDLSLLASDIEFDDADSLRGSLGLRVGAQGLGAPTLEIQPFFEGRLWYEFLGDNQVEFVGSGVGLELSDDTEGLWGQVGVGANVIGLGHGMSGFVRADYEFGNEWNAGRVQGGLRVTF